MAFRFLSPHRGPPPLPPKDEHYTRPLSPRPPSQFNESVVSESSSSVMSPSNKLSIASFLSRFPRSASSREGPNDDGISLPWNFQHHIHVDEGYVGLPPSWLTSTFTEEEIAQIQARRTAVLHGVGGGYHHQMRPPSPTSSLYPSVIQGHRRNKSSIDSAASSSTPNLVLPSQHPIPQSLSSTNLALLPSSPSVPPPLPLRPSSPAPTNASSTQLHLPPPLPPPTTPSASSFPLAPRNILSDLSSASSNIVGAVKSSGMRLLRVKRNLGRSGPSSPPSSFENSSTNRGRVHSRLSDETFFPPEIVSPDRATVGSRVVSPTNDLSPPPSGGPVAPVWELYTTSKTVPSTTTANPNQPHTRQRSMSSSVHSSRSSSRTSSTQRDASNPNRRPPSRSSSLSNTKNTNPNLARSLSRSRSLSPASAHPYSSASSSTPPLPSFQPPPAPSSSHPSPHRPPHLVTHSQSGSMSSLVSIPEASPAPGAVVPFPMPVMPPGGKGSLTRKSAKHGGANGYGPGSSRHHQQHYRNPSTGSTSAASHSQTNLTDAESSSSAHSHKYHGKNHHLKHQHTASTSSQQSTSSKSSTQSSTSQAHSSHSHAHSNSSSHSIATSSSSIKAHSNEHIPELPMLSLPRLSISLPFGEDSFFTGGFGTALGSTSTSTSTAGRTGELVPGAGEGGASWSGSTTSGSAFGSSLSRWFDNSETPTNASVGARSGTSASTNYASGSNGNNVASGSGSGRGLTASGSGNTNASGSGVGASGRLYDPPPPKLIPGSSSSTTTSTLTFPSTGHASSSTSHLASSSSHLVSTSTSTSSTSTPNLASTSTSNSNPTSTLTLPQNSNTSQIPIPTTSATPSRPRTSVSGKGSPPRRRPLPSSKPYPGYPVPALPLAPPSLKDAGAGITKLVPVPPTPFSPFATSARHLPSPLPVPPVSLPPMPPVASGSGSDPGSVNPSTIATASHLLPLPPPPPPPPPPPSAAALQQQQPSASLLSPPPVSAIFSPNGMLSPTSPLSAATSAAQSPNSAQLWSEIAHMMDPGMLSAIPGLHLSTALPEDARDAVRKAGETVGAGSEEDKTEEGGEGGAGKKEVALVGDLVGPSPPVSADLSGGVKEGSISRVEEGRERADKDGDEHEEDEDSESEEEYEDEESYDGVVQSVVVARPHPLPQAHSHSHPHLQSQPLPIPTIPCVIEPLRTVGRPRLVNVNANGLAGEEQARLKEASVERKGGDVDADVESNKLKISELSTQEKYRDSIRSSTTTIVPSGSRGVGDHAPLAAGVDEVNGQGGPSRTNERPHHHHRPPSMKLWISNGIEHHAASFAGNGMRAESSAMATMGTAEEEEEEEEGGEHASPFLNYYLEDVGGTPSPLPSPGSALGSPLRDDPMFDGESEGEGVRSGGSGLELEATPTSSFSAMYSSRRYGFENGHDGDEYGLSSRSDDAERVVAAGNRSEEPEDEDDFYVDSEEDEGGKKEGDKQARALPLTTPTIILNDGTHSPANDDDNNKTRTNKAPLNDAEPSSISSSVTDLTDTSLSLPPSPFQQRYCGWVSTLVAPLSEFIDEAVDPREHYLDLTEIAEGESGSVYAAKVNRSNAKKLRLGDVVRMQDSDDLGLGGNDDNDNDDNDRDNVIGNEKRTKLVAIKSIALVPNGTPKLVDLLRELNLMKGLWHFQVLSVDAVYVDLVEDSVWLRMELMERSLADVIVLVDRGLVLQERTIARFASDVLLALEFLLRHNIAHRDVRSDNMLINNQGVLKLADFTNAVRVDPTRPLHTDVVGVPFWQAPELLLHNNSATAASSSTTTPTKNNVPPYDPLKLDVWSLGSTVWEMAETVPPFFETGKFGDRWPPLSRPGLYSPAFHEFLRLCSEPAGSRPTAAELLQAHFINNACGRLVIVQLLTQCRTIERSLRERNDDPS